MTDLDLRDPEWPEKAARITRNFAADVAEITGDTGGFLRCETCGTKAEVNVRYWREGWPKCHGYTMRWWTQRQIDAGEVASR